MILSSVLASFFGTESHIVALFGLELIEIRLFLPSELKICFLN